MGNVEPKLLLERVETALDKVLRRPLISRSPIFGDLASDTWEETRDAEYVRIEGRFSDRYAVVSYQEGVYRYFGGAKSPWGYEESDLADQTIFSRDTRTFDEMIQAVVAYFRQYGREAEMADTNAPEIDLTKPALLVVNTRDGYAIPVESGQSCAWAAVLWDLLPAQTHVAGIRTRPTPAGRTEVLVGGSISAKSTDLVALEQARTTSSRMRTNGTPSTWSARSSSATPSIRPARAVIVVLPVTSTRRSSLC